MRIQHNIMAMSAYRNYTNNVSAMKKNLEKLSSGYKINRAGDDAAGLAISEKMRAQITGLETAQKNAKDGISLVQTAEGALTEVHDMLNRMVELASMSANGTYDDTTDRAQLQKEMDQLVAEINRIADSSNFNGINLLDGSMDAGADATRWTSDIAGLVKDNATANVGDGTILHKDGLTDGETKFNVDFNNAQVTLAADTKIELILGGDETNKLTLDMAQNDFGTAAVGDTLTAADIVNAFAAKYDGTTNKVYVKGADGTNQEFTIKATPDNHLEFTQAAKPTTEGEVVKGAMSVKITGLSSTSSSAPATTTAKVDIDGVNPGDATTKAAFNANITFAPDKVQTVTVGDKVFQINPAAGTANAAAATFTGSGTADDPFVTTRTADMTDADIVAGIAAKLSDGVTISGTKFNVTAEGTTLKFEADAEGAVQIDGADATVETMTALAKTAVTTSTPTAGNNPEEPSSSITVTATAGTDGKAKGSVDLSSVISQFNDAVDANTSGGSVTIDGTTYDWGTTTGGTHLSGSDADTIKAAFKTQLETVSGYTATWADDGTTLNLVASSAGAVSSGSEPTVAGVKATLTDNGADAAKAGTAKASIKLTDFAPGGKLSIGGGTEITFEESDFADIDALKTAIDKAAAGSGFTVATAKSSDGTAVEITVTEDSGAEGKNTEAQLKAAIGYTAPASSGDDSGAQGTAAVAMNQPAVMPAAATDGNGNVIGTMDYNASTEVITQGAAPGANRLASTYMDIKTVKDGSMLKVGDKTYTFAVGKNSTIDPKGENVVDMTGWNGDEEGFLDAALEKLTRVAEADGNEMFSIGYRGNGRVTFTEQNTNPSDEPLDTYDNIAKQFGYAVDGQKTGGGLKLQIGDTADSYNQLTVNIKDMHAKSLGLDGITIANQEGAANAIDAIKTAINTVSDVRGTLGATQNRLDHTINNLSVMTENIQDAESTIRDVDVAEEMMAYTKNNILIQSAQAMLAQANQVPQGVLQLLQ